MKKDFIRDYATAAFRYYADCGCKTMDEVKEQLYNKIYEQSKKDYATITKNKPYSSSVEYAIMAAEKALEAHKAELLDLLAVETTLKQLEGTGTIYSGNERIYYPRRAIRESIINVYFFEPGVELKKDDISNRVQKVGLKIPASERQVYRWLKMARTMFAENRGIRVP